MQKIYVVTSGEYSDYHIEAVFSDAKMAHRYAELHTTRWCTPCVEVWKMDEITVADLDQQEKDTKYYWEFKFNEDGELMNEGRYVMEYPIKDPIVEEKLPVRVTDTVIHTTNGEKLPLYGCIRTIIFLRVKVVEENKTRDQCLKIAQDMRTKYLAEQEGLC